MPSVTKTLPQCRKSILKLHGFSLGHLRVKEREVTGNVQIFTQNHIISGAKVSVIVFAGSPAGSQMMRLLQDRMHKQKLTVT